jgi:hypothetical protein
MSAKALTAKMGKNWERLKQADGLKGEIPCFAAADYCDNIINPPATANRFFCPCTSGGPGLLRRRGLDLSTHAATQLGSLALQEPSGAVS